MKDSLPGLLVLLVACGHQTSATDDVFSATVDPSVSDQALTALPPQKAKRSGRMVDRHIAHTVGPKGQVQAFLEGEFLFNGSEAEAEAFAAKYNGAVIGSTEPPPPPDGSTPPATFNPIIRYVVSVDTSTADVTNMGAHAKKLGLRGKRMVSSTRGAQTLALFVQEAAKGTKLGPNYVTRPATYPFAATEELPRANGSYNDAFNWAAYADVRQAWQFIWALQNGVGHAPVTLYKPRVAIIDGGFWLDQQGFPFNDSSALSDLPRKLDQYNFANNSFAAGGPNLNNCGAAGGCMWHGNGVASIALGALNNGAGAAGVAGQVAEPVLFNIDGSDGNLINAVNATVSWKADIANMSECGSCDDACHFGRSLSGYFDSFKHARDNGVMLIACAGNGVKVDGAPGTYGVEADGWEPCTADGVALCVGATDPTIAVYAMEGFSNFGPNVTMWAPDREWVMPDGSSKSITNTQGTSDSTPFVTGVAALMKAVNPKLTAGEIVQKMQDSAWTREKLDPFEQNPGISSLVSYMVRPMPALLEAYGKYDLAPVVVITAPPNGIVNHLVPYEPVKFTGMADDVLDGALDIVWTSDLDGQIGTGDEFTFDFTNAPAGNRHITATAKNSSGKSSSASIDYMVVFDEYAPQPTFVWPTNLLHVAAGSYTVTGYAKSTNPGDLFNIPCEQVLFNGSIPGAPIGQGTDGNLCSWQWNPSQGSRPLQKISLSASNRFGQVGTTSLEVDVGPPETVAQIASPVAGSSYRELAYSNGAITLSGGASFVPDGTTATFSWVLDTSVQFCGYGCFWRFFQTPLGTTSGGTTSQITWVPEQTGQCSGNTSTDVTIELDISYVDPSTGQPVTAQAYAPVTINCETIQ